LVGKLLQQVKNQRGERKESRFGKGKALRIVINMWGS